MWGLTPRMTRPRRKEEATCAICKKPFVRDAQASRKAKVCPDARCRKIMKLGHEKPVSLASIPTGNLFVWVATVRRNSE